MGRIWWRAGADSVAKSLILLAARHRLMAPEPETLLEPGDIRPDHWLAEYTTELLNILHVLTLLVDMEPGQAKLLEVICAEPTLDFRR